MPEPTTPKLQAQVQKIINLIFTEGQLDECDLTLKDLNLIAQSFLHTLEGIYHARPEYPPGGAGRAEGPALTWRARRRCAAGKRARRAREAAAGGGRNRETAQGQDHPPRRRQAHRGVRRRGDHGDRVAVGGPDAAPPGWSRARADARVRRGGDRAQRRAHPVVDGRRAAVGAGEVGLVPEGQRVVYRNDGQGACDYCSVCAPAFRPELAHMEEDVAKSPRRTESRCSWRTPRASACSKLLTALARALPRSAGAPRLRAVPVARGGPRHPPAQPHLAEEGQGHGRAELPGGRLRPRARRGRGSWGTWSSRWTRPSAQAKEYGRTLEAEVARYLAHGLLHLLGHDHEQPPERPRDGGAGGKALLGGRRHGGRTLAERAAGAAWRREGGRLRAHAHQWRQAAPTHLVPSRRVCAEAASTPI